MLSTFAEHTFETKGSKPRLEVAASLLNWTSILMGHLTCNCGEKLEVLSNSGAPSVGKG